MILAFSAIAAAATTASKILIAAKIATVAGSTIATVAPIIENRKQAKKKERSLV